MLWLLNRSILIKKRMLVSSVLSQMGVIMFKRRLDSIINHIHFNLLGLFFVFTAPLLAFFILESFSNGSLNDTFSHIRNYPTKFILNYILMFGIINIFYVLPRRAYLVIITILIFTFSKKLKQAVQCFLLFTVAELLTRNLKY